MDPETHEIFVEKDVHFEESSPNLSSTPLRTSYIVEINSDFSDGSSTDSDSWGSSDSCISHHQSNPHAYIAIVTGRVQQDSSTLLGLASDSDLGDSTIDLPLLDVVPSLVVMGVPFDPLDHSPHDRSLQVEMSVDTYGQQPQQCSPSVAVTNCSLR